VKTIRVARIDHDELTGDFGNEAISLCDFGSFRRERILYHKFPSSIFASPVLHHQCSTTLDEHDTALQIVRYVNGLPSS
jgi:hypothetical protein